MYPWSTTTAGPPAATVATRKRRLSPTGTQVPAVRAHVDAAVVAGLAVDGAGAGGGVVDGGDGGDPSIADVEGRVVDGEDDGDDDDDRAACPVTVAVARSANRRSGASLPQPTAATASSRTPTPRTTVLPAAVSSPS